MEAGYWLAPLQFLADTLTTLYTGAVLLRLLLQLVQADYYNPLCQFVVKITHPVLRPLRRAIPSAGRFDTASLVLILLLQVLALLAISLLQGATLPNPAGILILACMRALELLFDLYLGIIIGGALLSWVAPYSRSPVVSLIDTLSEPVLAPARRVLPNIGGLDLSPLVALMALELARMLTLPLLQQLFRLVS
jgi:YggT family protein